MPTFSKGYTSSCRLAIPVSAYQSVQAADWGVVQPAIPTVTFEGVGLWYVYVSNAFKVYKPVQTIYPQQPAIASGVVVGPWQCIAPVDPGRSTGVTSGSNTYMQIGQFLYLVTTSGTTAAAFPVLNQTAGVTTTDGTATWTCKGRQALLRAEVINAVGILSPPVSGPVATEIDFYQL